MDIALINLILKTLTLHIFIYATFLRLNADKRSYVKIILGSVVSSIFYIIMKKYFDGNIFMIITLSYFLQIFIQKFFMSNKGKSIIVSNLMANAVVYTLFSVSLLIVLIPKLLLNISNKTVELIITLIIEFILLRIMLKMKRIKHGIEFLKNTQNNDYFCIIMLNICAVVLFAYCIFSSPDRFLYKNILLIFIALAIIMVIMIQKTLTLYYKQKLLVKNIEDYKSTIAEKYAQIKALSDEKFKISKLNHEFYNRQKALELKVSRLSNMDTEASGELDVSKQIKELTKEYSDKAKEIKKLDKLSSTDITEIDDMFKYMQNECANNNIQFNLQVNGNIHHMINKKISQNKLVTLIGDHLRDAIIAIDFSNNTFKSILAVLGENNGVYEFCVFDTGIEFKIDTLLNLGLKPATTHKDSGGTGIGFMTTFETMKETKASLIIDEMREMSNTDYTKSVTIRFDGKNEYRIKSYRSDEIKKEMKDNRIIIENKKGSSTQWN